MTSLLVRSLLRQKVDRTPVWIMRQAGRYLPEYRQIRKKIPDFITLYKTPELATEITLQPLKRFPLDAAILFSDILTIPEALQLGLHFVEGEGPKFKYPIQTQKEIENLPRIDSEADLNFVMQTIRLIKQNLSQNTPLIGFSGSPWTLAAYMIEGQGSKEFIKTRRFLYEMPEALQLLLQKLSECVSDYLLAQIKAGVDVVMIFDTWGGLLGAQQYQHFSLLYIKKIVEQVKTGIEELKMANKINSDIPIILFSKNGGKCLLEQANCGVQALGLDWTVDLREAKKTVGRRVALQGNLDPAVLYGNPKSIRAAVATLLENYGEGGGHVFNLGHGIPLDVNPDAVSVMIEAVQSLSQTYHTK